MPRTVEEILAHADELAARFENYEPNDADKLDVVALQALRAAVAEGGAVVTAGRFDGDTDDWRDVVAAEPSSRRVMRCAAAELRLASHPGHPSRPPGRNAPEG